MCEVADPLRVWRRRPELPVSLVVRTWQGLARLRRLLSLATISAPYPKLSHQPFQGAAGHVEVLPVHLVPELAHPVDLEVPIPDTLNLGPQPNFDAMALIAADWLS